MYLDFVEVTIEVISKKNQEMRDFLGVYEWEVSILKAFKKVISMKNYENREIET